MKKIIITLLFILIPSLGIAGELFEFEKDNGEKASFVVLKGAKANTIYGKCETLRNVYTAELETSYFKFKHKPKHGDIIFNACGLHTYITDGYEVREYREKMATKLFEPKMRFSNEEEYNHARETVSMGGKDEPILIGIRLQHEELKKLESTIFPQEISLDMRKYEDAADIADAIKENLGDGEFCFLEKSQLNTRGYKTAWWGYGVCFVATLFAPLMPLPLYAVIMLTGTGTSIKGMLAPENETYYTALFVFTDGKPYKKISISYIRSRTQVNEIYTNLQSASCGPRKFQIDLN